MSALLSGNVSSRRLASAAPLVRATETVTPSAIRATVHTLKHPRPHWDTSNCIGIQYLNPRNERSLEALGHDPDDRVRELVERHRPPQCPHRAAEALLPERVDEQNHPLPARNVFLG
jgi:hypothetical protein